MKSQLSIASQIVFAVIATVVVVLGISSVIELKILKNRETQSLQQRGALTADRISNNLAYPLWNLNRAETERVVVDELVAQEVASIQVFDEQQHPYVGKSKSADGSVQDVKVDSAEEPYGAGGPYYKFRRDIRFNNNLIGSVVVDVSAAYLQPEVAKLSWGIAIKLLLLVVVLSLVLSLALRMLVVRRLSLLKSWIEGSQTHVKAPRFKYSAEIDSLAEAFGNMSAHLHQQHEALEREQSRLIELNTQLEEKIEQLEQAETALRESENRFAQITENISEVLWLNTPDYSEILYISPTYEKVWGRTIQSLQENPYSFLEAVHPDDRAWVESWIRKEHQSGFSLEYRIVLADGSVRWIWDRGFPIRDEKGVVHRIAGIAEDVTERRQAQEDLRNYANRVHDLYNNAPCGYHSLDAAGVYVQVNDTELGWLGRTRDEVIGKLRFVDVLVPEQRSFFEEKYRQFIAEGSIRDVEYQLVSIDGSSRSVLLSATALKDANGKFEMSRATVYDVTDRRHAEKLVEHSEEKFGRAFGSSPVALAVTAISDGRFIEVNQATLTFLGYTKDELIGNSTLSLGMWLDLDARQALIDELNQHGSVRGSEIGFRTKDGKVVVCLYSAEKIEVDGEPCILSVLLDITERRYMEQALKANEELLRLFVKHTPAAIAMFDTEMRYLQVSDRFLTDYDLEGQDLIGKRHYDVFPNLPDRWKEVHRRILAGAVERNDEDPYELADGTTGWLQWESLPWRKPDGEIGGLILFTQLITERKRAEQALRSSEERFAKIFNLSPYRMGIVRVSDGMILDVNDCWLRDTGFSRDEIINRIIYEQDTWLSEEDRSLIRRYIKEMRPFRSFEGTLTTKSGEQRYALSSAALVEIDGELCYLWASNDITERKRAEEELERSERRYRTLFETAPDAVGVFDAEDHLIMVNERGKTFFGVEQGQDISGYDGYDFIAPEDRDRVRKIIEEMKSSGKLAVFESTGLRRDNTRFDIETRATLIPAVSQQPPFMLTVTTDITKRKSVEKAVKASEEQLRALSAKMQSAREEEGTRIAREIHDELGGALTGLKWDLESLDSRLPADTDNATIAQIRERVSSMTGLIESTINSVRRISSELRPGVLDDLGLVAAIEWQAQQFERRTGLKVGWETELENVEISRDAATAVFRIFQEVLTNVLRHSHARNIHVRLFEDRGQLQLEVVDDGRGITDDEQQNTRSLGLLGMKERALLVGGAVNIIGAPGKGTTVVVKIPLSTETESHAVA